MRIDLHCHSEASSDCSTPIAELGRQAVERNLSVLAVTDHDAIWGARELAERSRTDAELESLQVIVGEEVTTARGEIIGLFLEERIPPGLEPETVVRAIHDQGGLVLLPHGFDPFKAGRLDPTVRDGIEPSIDIVEGFNRRVSLPRYNRQARRWAEAHDKLASAGSDAHTLGEVGRAWTDVPEMDVASPARLTSALREGQIHGRWRQPVVAYLEKLWGRLLSQL